MIGVINKVKKPSQVAAHLVFAALFSLAFYFFKERYFADVSFYLAQVINTGNFNIEHGRYIGVVSQIWTLLFVKLHFSLKAVMLAYTLGDILYYYIIFNILLYVLKDVKSAIALLLSLLISVSYLFFCPVSELVQGGALLILFNSMLNQTRQEKNSAFVLMLFMLITVVWSHPLAFIMVLAFLLFYAADKGFVLDKRFKIIVIVTVLSIIVKFFCLDMYDLQKVSYHTNVSNNTYKQLYSLTYMKLFIPFFVKEYWIALLLAAITIAYYFSSKSKLKALIYFAAVMFIPLLMVATHSTPYLSNYTERMHWAMIPIVIVPFMANASDWLMQRKKLYQILIVFIVLTRLGAIYDMGMRYKVRTMQLENVIASTNDRQGNKFVWDEKNIGKTYSETGWALPEETMLLSSLQGETKTIVLKEDYVADANNTKLNSGNFLYSNNAIYSKHRFKQDNWLNPDYFKLKDTPYQNLNSAVCNDTSDTFARNISIIILAPVYKTGQHTYLPLAIKNTNTNPIYSGLGMACSALLSYHWYKGSELVQWQGICTPLEVDINQYYKQDINIEMPTEKGKYTLVADLKIGEKWCNINATSDIEID